MQSALRAVQATFDGSISLTTTVEVSAQDEFTRFVAEDGASLLRFARLLFLDTGDAEDALQTALLGVLRRWGPPMQNPHAYARTSLVNLARDRHRRRHLHIAPAEIDEHREAVTEDHAEALVAQAELDQLLKVLPARQRAAVVLRVIEGLSETETAAAMNCSTGTVKSSLSRGLARLRSEMSGAKQVMQP